MNCHSFSKPVLVCLAAVLPSIFNLLPFSAAQNDPYTTCAAQFRCGHLTSGIGYPFWGGDRPQECGHPHLQLVCENATATVMQMNNVKYRLLNFNPETNVLKIARFDLSQSLCLQEFTNTTLDSEIFEYAPGYVDLVLLYGCSALDFTHLFGFNCAVKGSTDSTGYPILLGMHLPWLGCQYRVVVPVRYSLTFLNLKDVEQAVKQGFEVRIKVDGDVCRECESTGGKCGYEAAGKRFACICRDGWGSKRCTVDSDSRNYSAGASTSAVGAVTGARFKRSYLYEHEVWPLQESLDLLSM